jgi:hypothetical protein
MRFSEQIFLRLRGESPKFTHRTEFIHKFVAIHRQGIQREDVLNPALNEQSKILRNFRERQRERVLIKGHHRTTEENNLDSTFGVNALGAKEKLEALPLFEITGVLVRSDHVASFIVNANHGMPASRR